MRKRAILAVAVLSLVLLAGWYVYSDGEGEPTREPSRAELGDVVIRYSHRTGLAAAGCGPANGRALSVTSDGRGHVIRGCERATLALTPREFGRLRGDLADRLSGHEGRHDWSGNVSDQPLTAITVVGPGGGVRYVGTVGGSGRFFRHRWFFGAKERLDGLFERIQSSGAVDAAAPIVVTAYGKGSDPAATWPRDIAPPGRGRVYEGREAARLRSVFGRTRDDGVRMPDGAVRRLSWQATLPGFDPARPS